MLFRRLPLPFYDKLRFISILGLIEHITQAQLCCMCYFLSGISSADSITNETYMPFIVAAGASLLVLSFASGWFTDYDRKHQHRGLQISSMLVLIGILIEVIVTFTATSAGKPVFYCVSRVFSMQASSSIWKILKARFESDLLVKSQGEETGLIKKSEKVPEKRLQVEFNNFCGYYGEALSNALSLILYSILFFLDMGNNNTEDDIHNKSIFVSVWLLASSSILVVITFTYKSITSKVSKAAALAAFSTGYSTPKKESGKAGREENSEGTESGKEAVDDEWGIPTNNNGNGKSGDSESGRSDEELGDSGEVITYNLRLRFMYLFRTKIVNVVSLEMILVNLVGVVLLFSALFGVYELCTESSSSSMLSSSSLSESNALFVNISFAMIWVCSIGLVASVLCAFFVTYCKTNIFFGIICPAVLSVSAVLAVVAFAINNDLVTVVLSCVSYAIIRSMVKYMFHSVNATCYDNNLGFVNCFFWFTNEISCILSFVYVVYGFSATATAVVAAIILAVFVVLSIFYVRKLFDDVKWISIDDEDSQNGIRDVLIASNGGALFNDGF